jgi:hypothetical protein
MFESLEIDALKSIATVARFFHSYRTIDIIQKKIWEIEVQVETRLLQEYLTNAV